MSDPFAPGGTPDEPDEPVEQDASAEQDAPAEPAAPRRGPVRRAVSGRRSRWVVGGVVALVLIGGSAAVTAAVVHHDGERVAVAVGPGGVPGLKQIIAERAAGFGGAAVVVDGGQVVKVPGGGVVAGLPSSAPAPLPALPADQAVTKAQGAVSGGKVESLTTEPEQGGGTAWQAVVLGPDGVRHLLTLDGASGSITSNTVMG